MTITTKGRSGMLSMRMKLQGVALGFLVSCGLFCGVSKPASAQTGSTPATSPATPADVIRQAGAMQGLAGQYAGQVGFSSQGPMPVQGGLLPLSPGDVIEIQVFATPELSGSSRVDENGDVTLPVGGKVHLAGQNPTQAAASVEEKLRTAQIMIDPHVRVYALQYASPGVTVLGEVARPGSYQLAGSHTLWDAISAAGGVTSNAGKAITIAHRDDPSHPESIPLNTLEYSPLLNTTPVTPGDSVVVLRAENYYVVGDAGRTGEFALTIGRPNTVLSALALCGGANRTAKLSHSSIIRSTPTGVQTIPVDLKKVMKNEAPNLKLQAQDILVIPRSGTAAYLDTFIPSATLAVTSAIISALVIR